MGLWLKYIFSGCPFLVAIVGQVLADPLSEAQQAYLQGDYTKAVELVRPLAEHGRNLLAKKMSPTQITKAQKMAEDCEKNGYQDCN